ncbi:hypothetical protein HELRODRAFT_68712, partial [Helobdella robusta]|uniref:E3 ubiquitin-protein ligase n=1 Tax=Helobdella robusta TaxID=6412 RepID=T1FZI7_HELRO
MIEGHECPICLQTCVQPVLLPCNHIFCYLCAKGLASHSKKCAMCRKVIPDNYMVRPKLLDDSAPMPAIDGLTINLYQWFYRGTNGWWQYDPRVSNEIELAFNNGEVSVKIMISGFLYIVDFKSMMQYRENIPSRSRCIKRDLINIPDKKGVAGL